MTGLEAIPLINGLLTTLIDRIKDRQTAGLVQQIQQLQHVIQAENSDLRAQLVERKAQAIDLQQQLLALKNKQGKPKAADPCPFCRHSTGELQDRKEHETFGHMDVYVGYYKCANCGKTYEHNM